MLLFSDFYITEPSVQAIQLEVPLSEKSRLIWKEHFYSKSKCRLHLISSFSTEVLWQLITYKFQDVKYTVYNYREVLTFFSGTFFPGISKALTML